MNRCRLLELPAELRNNIYEKTLLQDEPVQIDLTKPSSSCSSQASPSLSTFNLLQTCKQIYNEARNFIYDNTFEFITSIHNHHQIQSSTLEIRNENSSSSSSNISSNNNNNNNNKNSNSSNSSLTRLRKICQSQQQHQPPDPPKPLLHRILVCLDRNLAFENVAHHMGMLFRASEPLRELQKSGVDVAVYVSAQLCRGLDFSPRLEFHLRDVEEAKRELDAGFMRQRVEAGYGDGTDLKTVYFELLKMKLVEAFFCED
ncbi:hypothetical protein CERZMDRAFT_80511 [Cercospora zeae-maydis SCOH1-5]|uniref:F-box domain-containing protein n=1 Tax=Cercospora zeae-maydis SCOH1-5 TaxID=717836 RepID=A0A6A6FXB1_9PEZI|nr:hypothetical protein CERZMDRAFT_80511 [Cercospora zeae-maydis SCOH1-5]